MCKNYSYDRRVEEHAQRETNDEADDPEYNILFTRQNLRKSVLDTRHSHLSLVWDTMSTKVGLSQPI